MVKDITQTAEYKQAKAAAEKDTRETVVVERETPNTEPQITTEEVVAQNTELWYKARILEMLAELVEEHRKKNG